MKAENGNREAVVGGRRYLFDGYEIDPANRMCLHDGQPVALTGKVFDVLIAFVENPGRLLPKAELMERVWPNEFVEEGNLARNVSTLRKLLGDTGKQHKYIATVPGHGYKFLLEVVQTPTRPAETTRNYDSTKRQPPNYSGRHALSQRWIWVAVAAIVLISAAWLGRERFFSPAAQIRSLAVLPLRPLNSNDDFLGVGIADAVIRRISQTGKVTVRPTSAVIRYSKDEDTDAIAAGRQLSAEAVLEGNYQRSNDRLRVSLDLLRVSDGVSLWADNFDIRDTDIFLLQDNIAQQVVTRLRLQLDPSQQANLLKQYTTSPAAYDFYIKGIYSLDQRGFRHDKEQLGPTIEYFKKAIEIDPNYALAHAELAYTYAWMALFIDPSNDTGKWYGLAKEEIARSEQIDPELAESHVARGLLFWSGYEGYQIENGIRELLIAKRINPAAGRTDLAAMCQHAGLDDMAQREAAAVIDIDPTGQMNNDLLVVLPFLRGDTEAWLSIFQKVHPGKQPGEWYLLRTGQLREAETRIGEDVASDPHDIEALGQKGILLALEHEDKAARALVAEISAAIEQRNPSAHHQMYDVACVYALMGDPDDSVKWLRETANSGFPNYPLFERDHYLDHIRQSPEFTQFMSEQKAQWERFRQEFDVQ